MITAPSLLDRLRTSAQLWASANDASLARLSKTVINDGGFFSRVGPAGASTTTATLERFARFLGDPGNWPGGAVPEEARQFVHVTGVTAPQAPVSPGKPDEVSQEIQA